jgi:hypothetical protein
MELFPSVIRRRNAKEKCQKRVNTRENGQTRALILLWLQAAAHAQSIVCSGDFRCCSFSLLKVSQKCSQLIHMRFVPVLASGLETRNPFQNRQEKNEFYFLAARKIFLTQKGNALVRGRKKKLITPTDLSRCLGASIRNHSSELICMILSCVQS